MAQSASQYDPLGYHMQMFQTQVIIDLVDKTEPNTEQNEIKINYL